MAWTTPRTWTDGELVNAAIMNAHVRDNLNTLRTERVRKSADQTVNSTTHAADSHLTFPVLAGETWSFEMVFFFSIATGTTDGSVRITVPASTTGFAGIIAADTSTTTPASGNVMAMRAFSDGFSPGSAHDFGIASGGFYVARLAADVIVTTNGNVGIEWACSAGASSFTVKRGSFIIAQRM